MQRRLGAALVGLIVFAVYVRTLAPTVAGGDSGELITVGYTLGVAHPPGYPLYTLLAKLFTFLPTGTVAWRVNLLSAACGAGAATFLALAVSRWTGSLWAAVAAASLFAFSPRVWPHAVTAEVFALNNLFIAGLVYFTVVFWQRPDARVAAGLFFWMGLGLSNHHTFVFYAIPAAVFVLVHGGHDMRRPWRLAIYALCGAAGLLPYAYLPIASAGVPLMSWGDQTTVQGFLVHILRREYGTFRLGIEELGPAGMLLPRLSAYATAAFDDLFWIGPLLAVAGLTQALRVRPRGLTWCWIAAFVLFMLAFNMLANIPLTGGVSRFVEGRFWQQPHLVLCVFAGLGLVALAGRLGRFSRPALPAIALALAIGPLVVHFREQDKSRDWQMRDFAKSVLDSMPRDSLMLEMGDQMFNGLRYMQIIEGYRRDVRVLDQMLLGYRWHERLTERYFPDVTIPGRRLFPRVDRSGDYGMRALFDANYTRFPIYLCDVEMWADARGSYTPWPSGLVDRVLRTADEPQIGAWMSAARASFDAVDVTALAGHPADSWERASLRYYWKQMGKHALSLGRWAQQHNSHRAALTRAAALMEAMLAQWPDAPYQLHRDLGTVYQSLTSHDPSFESQMRREYEAYLRVAPPSEPDLPLIRQSLQQRP